jgi:hypothetical protein
MDSCRISWGEVVAVEADRLTVMRSPLELVAGKLTLGAARRCEAIATSGGYVPGVRLGDVVSMHWSWACEVLKPRELARLRESTRAALALCNATL